MAYVLISGDKKKYMHLEWKKQKKTLSSYLVLGMKLDLSPDIKDRRDIGKIRKCLKSTCFKNFKLPQSLPFY